MIEDKVFEEKITNVVAFLSEFNWKQLIVFTDNIKKSIRTRAEQICVENNEAISTSNSILKEIDNMMVTFK